MPAWLILSAVRIAISGTHFSGKSTLVEELSRKLPGYLAVEEPYYLLADEGYDFPEQPSAEDYQAQLQRSIESLGEGEADVLFDRCPADFLAYLLAHEESDAFDTRGLFRSGSGR